jgi:hypothetical protein
MQVPFELSWREPYGLMHPVVRDEIYRIAGEALTSREFRTFVGRAIVPGKAGALVSRQ